MAAFVEFVEKVHRSRQTLLEILRERGYNTTGAEKVGPEEIRVAFSVKSDKTLEFTVNANEGAVVPTQSVRVYIFLPRLKQRLQKFLTFLKPTEGIADTAAFYKDKISSPADPALTTVICLLNEPVVPVFHQASAAAWAKDRLRLFFFSMDSFQMNPTKHYLVPKHEIVPKEQHEALLKDLYIVNKNQLPLIRYHEDPITRVIGCEPGDIIKITRPSPSSGEYIIYRACV